MISHALSIVKNELNSFLATFNNNDDQVELANVGEMLTAGGNGPARAKIVLTVVNMMTERTLDNLSSHVVDEAALVVRYTNAPVFLNLSLLVTATQPNYTDALLALSRTIRFFQHRPAFTPDTVAPTSLTTNAPISTLDRLVEFRLVFKLCSPSLEEVNHLWGTLGGRQIPFALYTVRMLEMRFESFYDEGGLVTTVISNLSDKSQLVG